MIPEHVYMRKGKTMIARNLASFAALAMATLSPTVASAQDADGTIVVTGEREVDADEVHGQARAITPRGSIQGEPLARFQKPVCPGVWGLDRESAQFIVDRIYFNAERLGLPLDTRVGCRPNIIAMVVADPDAELEELLTTDHETVRGLSFWERKKLRQQTGPVRSWNLVSTRTSDGQERSGDPPVFESTMSSRLNSTRRLDMESSVVMIDSAALEGKDGLALADYITMRALVRTAAPTEDEASLRTILSLFDVDGGTAGELTAFDQAYLRQIYSSRADMPAHMALRGIPGIVEKIIEGEE